MVLAHCTPSTVMNTKFDIQKSFRLDMTVIFKTSRKCFKNDYQGEVAQTVLHSVLLQHSHAKFHVGRTLDDKSYAPDKDLDTTHPPAHHV